MKSPFPPLLAPWLVAASLVVPGVQAQTVPAGELKGSASMHTVDSARAAVLGAAVVLPASVTGGAVFAGPLREVPTTLNAKAPVVVFLHGSSGLGLKAIAEWQAWLATQGVASIAPDSFALPDRLTYKSPVSRDVYEKIHALRLSEIALAVQALQAAPWADTTRMVLAGTSEGATAVARYTGKEFSGRIIYSWSCEDNYFVSEHRTALPADRPVLNVMSSTDVFFSPSNPWLGNPAAQGHCARSIKDNKQASVVLIPGAPHTLLNLPPARHATAGFVRDVLKP
ncbi:MAG: dienelactone hydrolase family protein [Aquabacterium sp.]|nr:dienelactone hydrolase family protein [Aquabacterium sp.]